MSKRLAKGGVSTRARMNLVRQTGNANAVAAGVDLTRVGVMSDRELAWIRALANEVEGTVEELRRQEEERRTALNKSRVDGWPDTVQARQLEFLRKQQEKREEDELRKAALDELYLQQVENERLAKLAQLELMNLKEDPRGRKVKSMVMLHEAHKGCENQIAYKEMRKREEAELARREQEIAEQQRWGDVAEDLKRKLDSRQRNMEEKNANLQAVLCQIEHRKQQRAEEKAVRNQVDEEAAEEAQERQLEKQERVQRDAEIGLHNKAVSKKIVSKAERLHSRIRDAAMDDAERQMQEEKSDMRTQVQKDRMRQKQEQFELRKAAGYEAYKAETAKPSPTYRTQDRFEDNGTSFLERMHNGDVERQKRARGARAQLAATETVLRHKAAATASGFLSQEEERAHLEEMRTYPEKVRALEAAEMAARKKEADRIAQIQKLQAMEKKEHERRERERELEEDRLLAEHMAADDARYQEYIQSQIPPDLSAHAYKSVLQR